MDTSKDQDRGKGAMEQDQKNQGGNTECVWVFGIRLFRPQVVVVLTKADHNM
jgi:hypothetical protein